MKVENISRLKKERFLLTMSEDDFRDKVVRPLFLRSGFGDGRDTCGPTEYGKDAVFTKEELLGLYTIFAVQTKKGSLNLSSKLTSNIVEAITQLRTALETNIVLLSTKHKVKPNRVILCCSGKINEAARNYIVDEIKNPNIDFLDADGLIPTIDRLLQELWLNIDADILPYYRGIERLIYGDAASAGSGNQEEIFQNAVGDESYLSISLYRSVIKKKHERGQNIEFPTIEEFPFSSLPNLKKRRILILGEAGSGKSTGILRIAYEMAKHGVEQDGKYKVPIFIKATELIRHISENFVSFCDDHTKLISRGSKSCFTLDDLTKGNVIIFIDGIDEVSSDSSKREIVQVLYEFSETYPKCQTVITSRPYKFINDIEILKKFEEYRVSPISWRQAEKLVTSVTEAKKIPKLKSQELLRRLEKIHGLELNPLLVTVFASTVDYNKQDIPANITELFKKFTEIMLGRWEEKKGFKHQYQPLLKDFVITKIAFQMHALRSTSILRHEAECIAKAVLVDRGHEADVAALLSEIFDRSGLFRVLGDDIEFRHHLLQEFFAGRGIENPEFTISVASDEWWRRPLVFYFGNQPDRVDLLKHIIDAVAGSPPGDLFQAATTIGLALQACYLSTVTEKLEIWKWAVKALTIGKVCFDDGGEFAKKYPINQFFGYYLHARDSVALSNLKQNCEILSAWAIEEQTSNSEYGDLPIFWFLVGLIESGDMIFASDFLSKNKKLINDGNCLAAISMGCQIAHELRSLPDNEKEAAKEIVQLLSAKALPVHQKFIKEYGSMLLELKNGKIEIIEPD